MTTKEDYALLLPSIEAIEEADIKIPNMPVDDVVQEARDLHQWSKTDAAELIKIGIGKEVFDEFPKRINALREAESNWLKDNDAKQEARVEWEKKKPETLLLKNEIEHSFRYAFRNREDLLRKVRIIEQGYDDPDMLQDLNDLAVIGRANTPLLKAIKFDLTKLEMAAKASLDMSILLAKMNGNRDETSRIKRIRDKAYTYVKEYIDKLRGAGKYVFWKNPDRLVGYSSNYFREVAKTKRKATVPQEA